MQKTVPHIIEYQSRLFGTCGIEIGGPSEMFGDHGGLPLYGSLERLDNCLFSARTLWTGVVQTGPCFKYDRSKPPGNQFICEASDMKSIGDSTYDCVLACHCLEHVANPLRALKEWARILKAGGQLLIILPHKNGTFDWRRPTTELHHIIEDNEQNVNEDDLTHLAEVLALHDLSKDPAAGTLEEFRRRCLDNQTNRAMHHHVFDTFSAVALLDHAGFEVIMVDTVKPFHIVILARRCQGVPDNKRFFDPGAESYRNSSFASDRLRFRRK